MKRGRAVPELSVVVPVFNEAILIEEFLQELVKQLEIPRLHWEILVIDDGSTDATTERIRVFRETHKLPSGEIRVASLSRNFGHQVALLCGMLNARGEMVITMDSDFQDPPFLIPQLITAFKQGNEIVLAKRKKRSESETFFKRISAELFYRIAEKISEVSVERDVGDFRLLSKRVNKLVAQGAMGTKYLRAEVSHVGIQPFIIQFDRQNRKLGQTKYSFNKMFSLALNGIIRYSMKPLRAAVQIAVLITILTFAFSLYVLIMKIFWPGRLLPGYTSTLVVMLWGFSGLFLVLAILGQYLNLVIDELRKDRSFTVREWH